jgi:hypothetical protein
MDPSFFFFPWQPTHRLRVSSSVRTGTVEYSEMAGTIAPSVIGILLGTMLEHDIDGLPVIENVELDEGLEIKRQQNELACNIVQ